MYSHQSWTGFIKLRELKAHSDIPLLKAVAVSIASSNTNFGASPMLHLSIRRIYSTCRPYFSCIRGLDFLSKMLLGPETK